MLILNDLVFCGRFHFTLPLMTLTTVKTCPNCSADLETTYAFCPQCGQTTHIHRFNLPHIFHEFFHAFTHADKGVLFLIRSLARRPGITAREYVLEGKRKKYFNPFTFLLIVLGLNLSVNILVKPYTKDYSPQQSATPRVTPAIPKEKLPYIQRRRAASSFIEKHINVVGLLAIPVFALIFWLFFRRTGINYSEHLVAHIFFAGFFSLVSIIATLLLGFVFNQYLSYLNRFLLLFQLVYLTIAYHQFIGYERPIQYLRTSAATLLALITWFVASGGAVLLYVYFGS